MILEENNNAILKDKNSFTSFSRLESFKKCSEYYHLKYVEQVKEEKAFNKALHIGNLVHSSLADFLTLEMTLEDSFYFHLGRWLEKVGLSIINDDPDDLISKIEDAAYILWRASLKCKDDSLAIRKQDGDILKDPIESPGRSFKNICNETGVTQKFGDLDREVRTINNDFIETSFSWLIAKAYYLVKYFEVPKWVKKTAHVELGISNEETNKVIIPNTEKPLQGYIDWIVELEDGSLCLLDHKTSKKKPTPLEVFIHPQLNIYVWLYEQIYGRFIELIGINHLESGEYVICDTNRKVVESMVKETSLLEQQIEKGVHYKHNPTEFQSPCIKKDWKTGKIKESCPYLSHCHPIFENLKDSHPLS